MTVGRPITAGRSRDRCVSNVVSNPISDAARAPSPLYRARGQRRPSAASGLPIRNDFGTLSRVDRFQHGESQLRALLSNHCFKSLKGWRGGSWLLSLPEIHPVLPLAPEERSHLISSVVVSETFARPPPSRRSFFRNPIPDTSGSKVGTAPKPNAIALSTLVLPCALLPCRTVSCGSNCKSIFST